MQIHFYDLLVAGKSPAEGQVVRFHSILFKATGAPVERRLAMRLREDVQVPAHDIDLNPLSLLEFSTGLEETQFSREVAPLFAAKDTIHIGLGNTTKLDAYVRHAIYRSLTPISSFTNGVTANFLDLETLLRALTLLRPDQVPHGFTGSAKRLDAEIQAATWEWDWDLDNRACGLKALLVAAFKSAPKFVEQCVATSSIAAIKAAMAMEGGEVSDFSSVQPVIMVHPSILSPGGFALLFPVGTDTNYPDIVFMADLTADLSALLDPNTRDLGSLVRTGANDARPLHRVSLSRYPFAAPLKAIRPDDARRLGVVGSKVRENVHRLRQASFLAAKLRDEPLLKLPSLSADVDHRMWAGDYPHADQQLLKSLQDKELPDWLSHLSNAQDRRILDLATRVLARECPHALSSEQLKSWRRHVMTRLDLASPNSLDAHLQALENAASEYPTAQGIEHLLRRAKGFAAQR